MSAAKPLVIEGTPAVFLTEGRSVTQSQLPGIFPVASMTLTTYLMPDGTVSHYEIEGRSPERSLTHYRAQAAKGSFYTDPSWVETVAVYTEWVARALYELAEADRLCRRTESLSGE